MRCSVPLLFSQGSDFWLALAVRVTSTGFPRIRIRVVYVASDASKAIGLLDCPVLARFLSCLMAVLTLVFFVLKLLNKLLNLFLV
jgi:hypothetical protein